MGPRKWLYKRTEKNDLTGGGSSLKFNNKGSFTVEGIIIISAVLIVLALLIFSFMVLYQNAVLHKTASYAAQQGAEIWVDSRKTIENGAFSADKERDGLYYRIFSDSLFGSKDFSETIDMSASLTDLNKKAKLPGNGNIEDKKISEIRRGIYKELYKGILKPEQTKISIKYSNILVERKLEVNIEQEIKIPLGYLKKFFSGKSTMTLKGRGVAVVAEPAEYIRNIDLGIECAARLKEAVDIGSLLQKIRGNAK